MYTDAHLPTEPVLDHQELDLLYQRKRRFNTSVCLQLLSQLHCLPIFFPQSFEVWFGLGFLGVCCMIHNLSKYM